MPRSGLGRGALAGVAVTAVLSLAFGTAGATQPAPAPASGDLLGATWHTSTGRLPIDIVSADFDHDGDADFAVAHERSEDEAHPERGAEIGLLLGDGKGGFALTRLDAPASALAVADLDADGNQDLIAPDPFRSRTAVLLGDGRGGFAPAVHYSTGAGTFVVADLNRDGTLDLAAGGSGAISVALGDGRGAFGAPTLFRAGTGGGSMTAVDLDGDGAAEIVTAGYEGVALYRNDGTGRLAAGVPLPQAGRQVGSSVAADVDGDGNQDLAIGGRDAVRVLRGDGKGGLGAPVVTALRLAEVADMAVGDLDGDAVTDLAIGGGPLYQVAALLGDGAGGYGPAERTRIPSYVPSVAIGDVNGDCAPDVVATQHGDDQLAIFLNTRQVACPVVSSAAVPAIRRLPSLPPVPPPAASSPVFAEPRRVKLDGRVDELAGGDFNGDGVPDLAFPEPETSTLGVRLGDGTGGFGPRRSYSTGVPAPLSAGRGMSIRVPASSKISFEEGPHGIAIGDVDGDGDLDLLTAMYGGDAIAVLPGDGAGGFGAALRYSTGPKTVPNWLIAADLDGDGDLDVVTRNARASDTVLLNDGTGAFSDRSRLPDVRGGMRGPLAVADLDGDGDPDLAGLTRDRPTGRVRALVAVLPNDGRGRFGKPAYMLSGRADSAAEPKDIVASDLDADGHPDLVVATRTRNISVLHSDGRGGIAPARIVNAGTPLRGKVKIADLTGDRIPDLVALDGASDVVVLAGRAGGECDKPVRVTLDGTYTDDFLLLDANGDGAVDILVPHRAGPELTVHLNTGPGSLVLPALPSASAADETRTPVPGFTEPTRYALGGDSAALATADFDRDGAADMAVAQPGLLRVAVSLGDGRGGFGQAAMISTGRRHKVGSAEYPNEPLRLAAGDLNGDGNPDLVVAMDQRTGDDVLVLFGDGHGRFPAVRRVSTGAGAAPVDVAVGDVTGDGRADVVTSHSLGDHANTGEVRVAVLPGDGKGGFGQPGRLAVGRGDAGRVAIADLGADGRLDVLVVNSASSASGTTSRLTAFRSDGRGGFGAATHAVVDRRGTEKSPTELAIGDVNRDGLPDAAVIAAYPGGAVVLLGTATGGFGNSIVIETPDEFGHPTAIRIGDLTGDEKPDLVVAANNTDEVRLYAGDGRGGFAPPVRMPTGGRGPGPAVVTDVDGNTSPDLVVLHTASDDLSVRRSAASWSKGRPQ